MLWDAGFESDRFISWEAMGQTLWAMGIYKLHLEVAVKAWCQTLGQCVLWARLWGFLAMLLASFCSPTTLMQTEI